jgi:CxxC motif-containing protein (DUF1111 family)
VLGASASLGFAQCPFAVAGNAASPIALSDGLLLLRTVQSVGDAALTAGTSTSQTPTAIRNAVASNSGKLDIDGNGIYDATDAAIIIRYLAGFRDAALLPGGPLATGLRRNGFEVQGYIDGGCPDTFTPLFATGTPVKEQTQYIDADGTLYTRMGNRPTPRHAREGGEPPATAPDQGIGKYFEFPPFYFQNRTWGLIIKDEVPAGRQKITFYITPNQGTIINNSINFFRRIDPGAIEYGWKVNAGYNSDTCNLSPTNTLSELCISNPATSYRRTDDDVLYQGKASRPNNNFVMGDKIEVTAGVFLPAGVKGALVDGGPTRNYALEQLYVVGKGIVPWYGIAPKLDSEPIPAEALLGGLGSVSYNYSEEAQKVFQQAATNIGISNMQRFVEGRRLFHTSFLTGKHSENPDVNPVFAAHIAQLGQRYNEVRCLGCHTLNGRSPAPSVGSTLNRFGVLTASSSTANGNVPDPTYGTNVQQISQAAGAANYVVQLQSYVNSTRTLAGGQQVELQKPVYAFSGGTPAVYSVRQAPQVIGLGLLEAVDESTILAFADANDANGDGVRGVPNWSIDPLTGVRHLGRFGWKASKGSIMQQIASAFIQDMGVTTPVYKTVECQRDFVSTNCKNSTATPSVSTFELDQLSHYMQLVGVPAQRKYASGYTDGWVTPPEHVISDATRADIALGSQLFEQVGCASCHRPTLKTGGNHYFQELRNQTIHPYTDLLLHDMGPDLTDGMTEGQAGPQMWRTPPLWGLGSLKYVQQGTGTADTSKVRYLHDGRARTLLEAIAWHGGEGSGARARFEALSKASRDALIAFIDSL